MKYLSIICLFFALYELGYCSVRLGGWRDINLSDSVAQNAVETAISYAAANGPICSDAFQAIRVQQQVSGILL